MAKKDRIDLTDDRYREFLEKLSEDDEFRAEIERNPRQVLDEYDVPYEADKIPDPVVMTPKAEVKAHLEEHLAHLRKRGSNQIPAPVFPKPPGGPPKNRP